MMQTMEDKVDKLYTDMYFGDGKENPSMTTRMTTQELLTEQIGNSLSKIVWATIGTFLSAAASIILRLVFKI